MKAFKIIFVLSMILAAPISALADNVPSQEIPNASKGCPFAFGKLPHVSGQTQSSSPVIAAKSAGKAQ